MNKLLAAKDEFGVDTMQADVTLSISDIPTLSHSHTSASISHAPNALAAISTNPQQSSPQQAL
jgi:hypothetical protein